MALDNWERLRLHRENWMMRLAGIDLSPWTEGHLHDRIAAYLIKHGDARFRSHWDERQTEIARLVALGQKLAEGKEPPKMRAPKAPSPRELRAERRAELRAELECCDDVPTRKLLKAELADLAEHDDAELAAVRRAERDRKLSSAELADKLAVHQLNAAEARAARKAKLERELAELEGAP